jgi:hypothetical protein
MTFDQDPQPSQFHCRVAEVASRVEHTDGTRRVVGEHGLEDGKTFREPDHEAVDLGRRHTSPIGTGHRRLELDTLLPGGV